MYSTIYIIALRFSNVISQFSYCLCFTIYVFYVSRPLTLTVSHKFFGYCPKIPWKICDFWGIY